MSAITDWAAKEQADLTAISGSLTGVIALIKTLNDQITALQNSPGTLSTSDQAALDQIQATSDSLKAQASAILTPVVVQTPPPPGP